MRYIMLWVRVGAWFGVFFSLLSFVVNINVDDLIPKSGHDENWNTLFNGGLACYNWGDVIFETNDRCNDVAIKQARGNAES